MQYEYLPLPIFRKKTFQLKFYCNLKLLNSFDFATEIQELRFSFYSREIVKSAAHKKKHEFNFKSHEFIFGEVSM